MPQPSEPATSSSLLSLMATASRLSISERGVRRLIAEGELGSTRIGKRILVPAREVERYIALHEQQAEAARAKQRNAANMTNWLAERQRTKRDLTTEHIRLKQSNAKAKHT